MNMKEWYKACEEGWAPRRYDNASREIQLSLKYNPDPKATVRHHLRDTEEQRKYNDEHYELWGFEIDESGDEHFEYGKYVVFVTREQHSQIHMRSEETRKKISETETGKFVSEETRKKISESGKGRIPPNKGIPHSAETRKKISENTRTAMTDEARRKCSDSHKGLKPSEETKLKMSNSAKARVNDEFRDRMRNLQFKRLEDDSYRQFLKDTAKRLQSVKSAMYKEYKAEGGTLLWNEFQKYVKDNNLLNKYKQGDNQCPFHAEEE